MKDMMKKEFLYGVRNNKFLIIAILYAFFAFSVPVMVKVLLPAVLKSQFPGMSEADMALMIDISQTGSMVNYMKNIFEIGIIVIGFTLSGLLATELKDNTLVLPICTGRKYEAILLSKFSVFAVVLFLVSFIALLLTYLYSGFIFDFDISLLAILKTGLLDGVFVVFVLSLILFYGSYFKKAIPTGLVTVGTVYIMSIIGSLFKISKYLPTGLNGEAGMFRSTINTSTVFPLFITIGLIMLLLVLTLRKLKVMEWNQR